MLFSALEIRFPLFWKEFREDGTGSQNPPLPHLPVPYYPSIGVSIAMITAYRG
jgi:hypothetical protein